MRSHVSLILLAILFVQAVPLAVAKSIDTATINHYLDGLRGMQVPKEKEKIAELNKRMDDAWSFISKNKSTALPIVEDALRAALGEKVADQFFLMDIGFLLLTQNGEKAADLAVSALERLDPDAEIIQANWEEVFHFSMKLGATGRESERYLAQMDRLFLSNKREIHFFRAPHLVQLNQLDIGCMVYGVTGEAGAQHLAGLIAKAGSDRPHILQILRGIGSEVDVPAVKAVMDSAKDYETLTVCIGFMMELGGPSGRAAVLALNGTAMEQKAKDYYKEIRPKANVVSFSTLAKLLKSMDKSRAPSDSAIQRLLNVMEENNGADDDTPPGAIAKSGLPTGPLLAQMKRIRTRSFRRETNHVFEDLEITNLIINALQFKAAKQ